VRTSPELILVRAIIGMAQALDLAVVAEGVETEEQRELLSELGCPLGQGYLFAAPQTAERFVSLLDAQRLEAALTLTR
jgi:EAL domain-containing protein (putative c-di-GMP-specific phosphodiesterase class I)